MIASLRKKPEVTKRETIQVIVDPKIENEEKKDEIEYVDKTKENFDIDSLKEKISDKLVKVSLAKPVLKTFDDSSVSEKKNKPKKFETTVILEEDDEPDNDDLIAVVEPPEKKPRRLNNWGMSGKKMKII